MTYKIMEFTVQTEKIEEAKQLIAKFLKEVKEKESEVLRYEAYQDQGGNRFFHLITFKDRKAESNHQQAPHTVLFLKNINSLCEKKPLYTTLDLIKEE